MSDFSFHRPVFGPPRSSLRLAPVGRNLPALLQTTEATRFNEMEGAFQASGGIASSDEVTHLLRRHTDQPISMLARWIVAGDVLSIDWQARMMIPLFQFDPYTMAPRPAATQVIRALGSVMSDWDVALWFARPNAWLGDVTPVEALNHDHRAVLDAARADQFLAHA